MFDFFLYTYYKENTPHLKKIKIMNERSDVQGVCEKIRHKSSE